MQKHRGVLGEGSYFNHRPDQYFLPLVSLS